MIFFSSGRSISSSLSSLVNNLLHKVYCKDCESCPKYETIRCKALQFNCPNSNQNYEKEFYSSLNMGYSIDIYIYIYIYTYIYIYIQIDRQIDIHIDIDIDIQIDIYYIYITGMGMDLIKTLKYYD